MCRINNIISLSVVLLHLAIPEMVVQGITTHSVTGCSDRVLLNCSNTEMIHVERITYYYGTDCIQAVTDLQVCGQQLTGSDTGLAPSCTGKVSCNEVLYYSYCPGSKAAKLDYRCIPRSNVKDMCEEFIIYNTNRIFLSSPNYPSPLNFTDISPCRCSIRGSSITSIQILELLLLPPNGGTKSSLEINYGDVTYKTESLSDRTRSRRVYNKRLSTTSTAVEITLNHNGIDNQYLWIEIQGVSIRVECKKISDSTAAPPRPTTTRPTTTAPPQTTAPPPTTTTPPATTAPPTTTTPKATTTSTPKATTTTPEVTTTSTSKATTTTPKATTTSTSKATTTTPKATTVATPKATTTATPKAATTATTATPKAATTATPKATTTAPKAPTAPKATTTAPKETTTAPKDTSITPKDTSEAITTSLAVSPSSSSSSSSSTPAQTESAKSSKSKPEKKDYIAIIAGSAGGGVVLIVIIIIIIAVVCRKRSSPSYDKPMPAQKEDDDYIPLRFPDTAEMTSSGGEINEGADTWNPEGEIQYFHINTQGTYGQVGGDRNGIPKGQSQRCLEDRERIPGDQSKIFPDISQTVSNGENKPNHSDIIIDENALYVPLEMTKREDSKKKKAGVENALVNKPNQSDIIIDENELYVPLEITKPEKPKQSDIIIDENELYVPLEMTKPQKPIQQKDIIIDENELYVPLEMTKPHKPIQQKDVIIDENELYVPLELTKPEELKQSDVIIDENVLYVPLEETMRQR